MMTLGGQQFAQAYKNVYLATGTLAAPAAGTAYTVTAQPFFETVLGGPGSAYCNQLIPGSTTARFSSCTQAVATLQHANFGATAVSQIWNGLAGTSSWILPNALFSTNQMSSANMVTSLGYGNYHAAFATLRMRDFHGLTAISNFTWGRALGTADVAQRSSSRTLTDAYNVSASYGTQSYDYQYLFNLGLTYQPKSFFGLYDFKSKHGVLGQLLNGWTVAPFLIMQSGTPIGVAYTEGNCTACQAFGAVGAPGVASVASDAENASFVGTFTGGHTLHRGVPGSNGIGITNSGGLNMFADPAAIYAQFRPCVLGLDNNCGGWGNIRGFNRWNLDATLAKDFRWKERLRVTVSVQFTNVLNHFQPSDPSRNLNSPQTFGVVSDQVYAPRNTEFGLRIGW
jgi:hypothetical protein